MEQLAIFSSLIDNDVVADKRTITAHLTVTITVILLLKLNFSSVYLPKTNKYRFKDGFTDKDAPPSGKELFCRA